MDINYTLTYCKLEKTVDQLTLPTRMYRFESDYTCHLAVSLNSELDMNVDFYGAKLYI